uniref:tRNA:m(4)X modification enzyme TRM13 n=1 Tax=Bombyx mori TaxID=7091 RepID=A0A8R2C9T2_BOMMO|nr:uncharacterized protein LOC101740311 isoform X4 [Bombyx mori]
MSKNIHSTKESNGPQCQYFVLRKKRLCRMTVRPGNQYCGEHQPPPNDCLSDKRIACPNDPKHTCYISKLEKHLTICNARQQDQPPYIEYNINTPITNAVPRILLSEIPGDIIIQVINKVNSLYDKFIKSNIVSIPERAIHAAVAPEFNEADRQESSRRHLRQTSSLLWLVEEENLVDNETCYVELGAGKAVVLRAHGVVRGRGVQRAAGGPRHAAAQARRAAAGAGRRAAAGRVGAPGAAPRAGRRHRAPPRGPGQAPVRRGHRLRAAVHDIGGRAGEDQRRGDRDLLPPPLRILRLCRQPTPTGHGCNRRRLERDARAGVLGHVRGRPQPTPPTEQSGQRRALSDDRNRSLQQ